MDEPCGSRTEVIASLWVCTERKRERKGGRCRFLSVCVEREREIERERHAARGGGRERGGCGGREGDRQAEKEGGGTEYFPPPSPRTTTLVSLCLCPAILPASYRLDGLRRNVIMRLFNHTLWVGFNTLHENLLYRRRGLDKAASIVQRWTHMGLAKAW